MRHASLVQGKVKLFGAPPPFSRFRRFAVYRAPTRLPCNQRLGYTQEDEGEFEFFSLQLDLPIGLPTSPTARAPGPRGWEGE